MSILPEYLMNCSYEQDVFWENENQIRKLSKKDREKKVSKRKMARKSRRINRGKY